MKQRKKANHVSKRKPNIHQQPKTKKKDESKSSSSIIGPRWLHSIFLAKVTVPIVVVIIAIILKAKFENLKKLPSDDDDNNQKIENFLNWLRQNGAIIAPSVTISSFPEFGGYGLQAIGLGDSHDEETKRRKTSKSVVDDIKNESTDEIDEFSIKYLDDMFTIPSSIIMTPKSIIHEFSTMYKVSQFQYKLTQLVRKYIPSSSMVQQDVVIALKLMVECMLGEESNFKPYLDILPPYIIPRLDTFNDEELDMLQDEDLAFLAKESYGQLQSIWQSHELQSLLSSMIDARNKNTDGISNDTLREQCISFHSFHKYVAIVSSRAMVLEGIKHLTPLAEFANYQPRQDNRKALKGRMNQSFLLYHERNDETGSITVRADRNVRPGQQIFEDYGDIDNSLYLEAHGFVPDENPFHCAVVPPNLIPSPQDLPIGLKDALVALKVLPDDHQQYPPPTVCILDDGSLSDHKAEAYVKIAGMTLFGKEQNDLVTQCTEAVRYNDEEFLRLQCLDFVGHNEMLAQVIQKLVIRTICKSKSRLSDDQKQLEELLATDASMQKILALKFRIADKTILENLVIDDEKIDCSKQSETILQKSNVEGCPAPLLPGPKTSIVATTSDKSLRLEDFKKFLARQDFPIQKVEPKFVGDGMRLGVVATQDIEVGEIYLSIKSSSVINKHTILNKQENPSLHNFIRKYRSPSGNDDFEHLILFLLHDVFISRESSFWHPYLNILPSIDEMKEYSPLFMNDELYNYAAGSDLRLSLERNKRRAEDLFSAMLLNKDVMRFFGENIMTRDNFLWAYSIVDSRSIWFNGERNLVPLLDLVNCMEIIDEETNTVNAVHKTLLDDSKNAVTKATSAYKAGDQIFENYGQPNYIYFSYHGFSLGENNTHDCAQWSGFGITSKDEAAKDMSDTKAKLSRHGFTSLNPSFCVRDISSLNRVAQFIRIKHGLRTDQNESQGLSPDVIPLLKQYLSDRIHRFVSSKRSNLCESKNLPKSIQLMMQIVEREQSYFEKALQQISSL